MQRVIDQLSETKDPKLFNRKINKLLDLFDKWEQNLLEREQHLLQNSKKLKNIQTDSSGSAQKSNEEKEMRMKQLQKKQDDRERVIEKREKLLFQEKQELESNLNSIKSKELLLQQEKDMLAQKENITAQRQAEQEYQLKLKIQAITSRIGEKENILKEKKHNQLQRQEKCQKEQHTLNEEKERVMNSWDEIILQAQQIKQVEQDNKKMILKLRDTLQNIDIQSTILDKKYESLHQMHEYQEFKQEIDDKEHTLKLKEENIRLLQRELAALRLLIQNNGSNSSSFFNNKGEISSAAHQQSHNRNNSPASYSDAPQNSQRQSSLRKQNNLQINELSSLFGNSGISQKTLQQKDSNLPKPTLGSSSSTSSITSNNVQKKAGNTSKIKQKFAIKNIHTDDSQIFSPISKHNPLLSSCSGISPLNHNRDDDLNIGAALHQTTKTINSGQNLCTINDTKSDQASKAPQAYDSTNFEYNKMHEKRRLFADQLQDPSDLHVVEEKSYNQLSLSNDSIQNSVELPFTLRDQQKDHHKYSLVTPIQKPCAFIKHSSKNTSSRRNLQQSEYQSVVQSQNDRDYYESLLAKKHKLLRNYQDKEEPNLDSDQQEEDSINLTHTLNASPSRMRSSYNEVFY